MGFFVRGAYFVEDKVYFTQNAALESLIEENESILPGKSYLVQDNSFESVKDAKNFIESQIDHNSNILLFLTEKPA